MPRVSRMDHQELAASLSERENNKSIVLSRDELDAITRNLARKESTVKKVTVGLAAAVGVSVVLLGLVVAGSVAANDLSKDAKPTNGYLASTRTDADDFGSEAFAPANIIKVDTAKDMHMNILSVASASSLFDAEEMEVHIGTATEFETVTLKVAKEQGTTITFIGGDQLVAEGEDYVFVAADGTKTAVVTQDAIMKAAEGRELRRDWCGAGDHNNWSKVISDNCLRFGPSFSRCCRVHDYCYGKCGWGWSWWKRRGHRWRCDYKMRKCTVRIHRSCGGMYYGAVRAISWIGFCKKSSRSGW